MTERRVQYLMVDNDAALWSSEAPSFKAQVADIASLEGAVRQRVSPQHTMLLLRDIDNMWVAWSDISELPQDCTICVKAVRTGTSENLAQVLEALEPIKQACADRLSLTRCASDISRSDLHEVRGAFRTNLQVKNAQDQPPLHEEELWSGRYEIEQVSKYLKTIKTWARFGRKLYFKDARGHVLRTAIPLKFPISGSNDLVLILRNYISDPEVGAFLGIELKRGLTAKGLRQAEVEFYLWSSCSLFPFVQIITDMQSGGLAFYSAGSSPTGETIVKHVLNGMEEVRNFVKNVIDSIPDDAGEDGPRGNMKIPRTLENPARKRHREGTAESSSGAREALDGQGMADYRRGLELIAAMQPDVGNELLGDLDDFLVCTQADNESRNAYICVS